MIYLASNYNSYDAGCSEFGDSWAIFFGLGLLVFIIIVIGLISGKKKASSKRTSNATTSNGEITTDYYDESVSAYFNDEQKSGCFGSDPKYPDSWFDDILLQWINNDASKAIALSKIGIDASQVNEIEPICFQGFESEADYRGRYGLDGRFRTTQYSVTWLFFSDSQIFVYKVFFDLLYHKRKTITCEYFYKDITNFSSVFSSYKSKKFIEKKGCLNSGYDSVLTDIETRKFSIVVPGDSFLCSVSGVANIDEIIQGLKQKLREKKEQRV